MANSKHQQTNIKRYYEHRGTMSLQKLGEIASDLFLCSDSKKAERLWERAAKALAHTDAQAETIDPILANRDVTELTRLINQLTGPKPHTTSTPASPSIPTAQAIPPATQNSIAKPPLDPTDKQVLKTALKAFRKRLKLTRLDEESKLGVGPLTGGKRSGVVAITPPNQYPTPVWEELVKQGKLKRAGTGFYALAQE